MLLAAVICFVVALVVMILRGETPEPNQYAWVALSSIIGSWAVLIPAKIWEGSRGDAALRRFVMLVIGLGLGTLSYGLMDWLMLPLRFGSNPGGPSRELVHSFFAVDGSPRMIAFLAYFGFLFVVPRWWRLADPVRSTRLSIWHTAVTAFWSWLLILFWPFPQPWGLMVAVTTCVAVQLASPWLSVAERG